MFLVVQFIKLFNLDVRRIKHAYAMWVDDAFFCVCSKSICGSYIS